MWIYKNQCDSIITQYKCDPLLRRSSCFKAEHRYALMDKKVFLGIYCWPSNAFIVELSVCLRLPHLVSLPTYTIFSISTAHITLYVSLFYQTNLIGILNNVQGDKIHPPLFLTPSYIHLLPAIPCMFLSFIHRHLSFFFHLSQ